MKITKKYPDFYLKYRDKKVSSYGIEGTIVGYLINSSGTMQLILEVDCENDKSTGVVSGLSNCRLVLYGERILDTTRRSEATQRL